MSDVFDNSHKLGICFWICVAIMFVAYLYFVSKPNTEIIEKEKTKQLELTLQFAQVQSISTNKIERQ
jgi:hypothetical protein